MRLPLKLSIPLNVLLFLFLYWIFSQSADGQIRSCDATLATTDGKKYVWLIHLKENSHAYLITDPKGSLDRSLQTCKSWLKHKEKHELQEPATPAKGAKSSPPDTAAAKN